MTQVEELLVAAREALSSGNQLVARGYLRRATRVAPDRIDIWRELLKVSERRVDRIRCLEHIVELDPSDSAAKGMLDRLRQKEEQSEAEPTDAGADVNDAKAAEQDGEVVQAGREPLFGQASDGGAPEDAPQMPSSVAVPMRPDVTDEMRRKWDEIEASGGTLYCIDHPWRETKLRCNRCGAPVCTDSVVRTPVGFRCKECVKAQQAAFYTARWHDYPVAAIVTLVLSIPAAALASIAGWWFAMIISPIAGGLIGGAAHWAIRRRRGRYVWVLVGACVVLGAVIALGALAVFGSRNLISIGIYAVMATGAAVGVLRLGRR